MPALLITRSVGFPNHSSAVSARASTSSNTDTSQAASMARSPISAAVSFAPGRSTSAHTTRPPRRASSTANARPIPLAAPVTTASTLRVRRSPRPNPKRLTTRPPQHTLVAPAITDCTCHHFDLRCARLSTWGDGGITGFMGRTYRGAAPRRTPRATGQRRTGNLDRTGLGRRHHAGRVCPNLAERPVLL